MKICVLGGTGYIGSRVVKRLLATGHEVVVLARKPARAAEIDEAGAHIVPGDINDLTSLKRAMNGTDVVVHVANPNFMGRLGPRRCRNLSKQVLQYLKNIVVAVRENGNPPLIVTEGTLGYGQDSQDWFDETADYNPKGYARLGLLSIPYLNQAIKDYGLKVIRLSPGGVYGPGSWFRDSVYSMIKKGWFRTLGDGQNYMSLVHVDDVAEAYRLAVEKLPIGKSILLADDEPCRAIDFANMVSAHMGRNPVGTMPLWLSNLLAGSVVVETMTVNSRARNVRAKQLLGWKLRYETIHQGIPATLAELGHHTEHKSVTVGSHS